LIASQTGIVVVIIEDEVTIWGQVGTTSGIEQRQLFWSNGVTKSVEGGKSYLEPN
jgi:UDP-3-O-[3-hydroxymyristoyl] glucosamine N-acyltransferase